MKLNASPFAGVSFAMVVGVMGAALISPLYGLYRTAWDLHASDVSLLYVVYMGGALAGLLFLGSLPDRTGFRPIMKWGLVMALLGTFGSLLAWNMASLSAARFVVGVSSGMATLSAPLGLSKLAQPSQRHRVTMLTSFLMVLGFGLGPLVGGVLGQWAPYPLVTTYLPPLVLGACALFVLTRLDLRAAGAPQDAKPLRWRDALPTLTWPQASHSKTFALTVCLPFLAFGVFGLYASMSPLFLDKLLPWHGPVVSGTAVAVILFASAGMQVVAHRVPTHWCGFWGLMGLAASNAVLMANLWASSAILFGLGVLLTAIGHGMTLLAGMSMVNRIATPRNRSGLLATYMVIGYVGSMAPMMGMGWIADHWGLPTAVSAFCTAVLVLATVTAVVFLGQARVEPVRGPA